MHPRVSVSAVCTNRWTLDEDLSFWAGAGIDRVGLSLRKLDAAGLDAAVRRVRDAGLSGTNLLAAGSLPADPLLAARPPAAAPRARGPGLPPGAPRPPTWG